MEMVISQVFPLEASKFKIGSIGRLLYYNLHWNFELKEQCHEDFAVLGQFCAKTITLRL